MRVENKVLCNRLFFLVMGSIVFGFLFSPDSYGRNLLVPAKVTSELAQLENSNKQKYGTQSSDDEDELGKLLPSPKNVPLHVTEEAGTGPSGVSTTQKSGSGRELFEVKVIAPAKRNKKDISQDNEKHGVIDRRLNEIEIPSTTQGDDKKVSPEKLLLQEMKKADQDLTEEKGETLSVSPVTETDYSKSKQAQEKRKALSQ